MKKCDMCGTKIEDGKCSCGIWFDADQMKDNPIKLALEHFHEKKRFTLTADMPHLGVAVLFFRGNAKDCMELQKLFYELKGRPYYAED